MSVNMGGSSLAKKNTGVDTRHESEQAQPIDPRGFTYTNAEKKQTPWKMPVFIAQDLTALYSANLPENWKLFRVTTPMPYKDFTREIYHLIEVSGKRWIIYTDEEITQRLTWLSDNENFIGYRG